MTHSSSSALFIYFLTPSRVFIHDFYQHVMNKLVKLSLHLLVSLGIYSSKYYFSEFILKLTIFGLKNEKSTYYRNRKEIRRGLSDGDIRMNDDSYK